MIKSTKILLMIFSIMYGGCLVGSERFSGDEGEILPYGIHIHELNRPEGYWTTELQFKQQGVYRQNPQGYNVLRNGYRYEPINKKHQREDWYKYTPYIAEFYSTVTSLPLFYVAYEAFKNQKPVAGATIFAAGVGSTVSHAIPRLWIHHVDTLTALSAVGGIVYDCNLTNPTVLLQTIQNPATLLPVLSVGSIYVADVVLAHVPQLQEYRKKWQVRLHSSWHLIAIYALFMFVCYNVNAH